MTGDSYTDGSDRPVELHPVTGKSTVWVTGHTENGFGHFGNIDGHRIAEGYICTDSEHCPTDTQEQ